MMGLSVLWTPNKFSRIKEDLLLAVVVKPNTSFLIDQDRRRIATIFKDMFLIQILCILIEISQKFVSRGSIYNNAVLV